MGRSTHKLCVYRNRIQIDYCFIGDSIRNGLCRYSKYSLGRVFKPVKALNLGIRGDTTQHVLWRIQNGEIPVNVESVVIHCGTNNLDKDSPAEIKNGIISIVNHVPPQTLPPLTLPSGTLRHHYHSYHRHCTHYRHSHFKHYHHRYYHY